VKVKHLRKLSAAEEAQPRYGVILAGVKRLQ